MFLVGAAGSGAALRRDDERAETDCRPFFGCCFPDFFPVPFELLDFDCVFLEATNTSRFGFPYYTPRKREYQYIFKKTKKF
jgi:hypothetical protein